MSRTPTPYILIKKRAISDWISCRSITSNLEELYRTKYGTQQVKTLFSDEGMNLYQSYQLLQAIIENQPEHIVWIDHHPHPLQLIKALYEYYLSGKIKAPLPTLIFHIFGDFSLQTIEWTKAQEYLKFFKTKFYVASHAQKGFFDQFVTSENTCDLLPFPTTTTHFSFIESERNEFRAEFSLSEQQIALLYTGRLSRQKNIIEVIEHFKAARSFLPQGTKLFIAGEFDDIDVPFIGIPGILGSFQRLWLKSMGEEAQDDSIIYLGNLSAIDLRKAYNGCDLFCSMSTHNDEDFGMAPAEAALTGLPLLLSRWGGYQSFKVYLPESCTLVEIDQVHRRIIPRSIDLQKKLLVTTSMLSFDIERRKQLALLAKENLSLEGLLKLLPAQGEIKACEFKGFNTVFDEFVKAFTKKPHAPFRNQKGKYNKFYHEVYRPYFKSEVQS